MNIQNRVFKKLAEAEKVELATQKVELAIGDELRGLASKTDTFSKRLNKELNDSFSEIRRIEAITSNMQTEIVGFKDFINTLQKMEVQLDNDRQKIKSAEQDLGIKIDRPKALDVAVRELETFQRLESKYRSDINEFNKLVRKYK